MLNRRNYTRILGGGLFITLQKDMIIIVMIAHHLRMRSQSLYCLQTTLARHGAHIIILCVSNHNRHLLYFNEEEAKRPAKKICEQ